MAQNLDYKK